MNDTSLKAKIRNFSKQKNISAQAVLQCYLMNRFLYRLSQTKYKNKLVIKGGMLISSIIGIEYRSTMDLDITLKDLPLTESSIKEAFKEICNIKIDDNLCFILDSINPIREEVEYGGYRVSFYVNYGKIKAPMSMDVSTGDIITPGATKHNFIDMFDKNICFSLWSYPIETVLAEKIETILSRSIYNTRIRDFYDVYMLTSADYDLKTFKEAFRATTTHRESKDKIIDFENIIYEISRSIEMNEMWEKYTKQMVYAKDISFNDTLDKILKLLK